MAPVFFWAAFAAASWPNCLMAVFMGDSVDFWGGPDFPSPSFFAVGSAIEMWRVSDEARDGGPDLCGVDAVLAVGTSGASVDVGAVKVPKS